jgi:hypothetical protein
MPNQTTHPLVISQRADKQLPFVCGHHLGVLSDHGIDYLVDDPIHPGVVRLGAGGQQFVKLPVQPGIVAFFPPTFFQCLDPAHDVPHRFLRFLDLKRGLMGAPTFEAPP